MANDRFLKRVAQVGPLDATVLATPSLDAVIEASEVTLESLFEPRPSVEDVDFDDCPPKYPEKRTDLLCGECGSLMELRDSRTFKDPFYGCSRYPECRGTHGAYPSGKPKGIPGNRDTKQARIFAHKVFDEVWKQRLVRHRGAAYNWMRQVMELSKDQAHIGMFTVEQCQRLIELVYRDYPSLKDRYTRLLYDDDPFDDL